MQQKKQRDRERKELDTLGRRHLANVRVVQRNVVYVVGIGSRAKEEVTIVFLHMSLVSLNITQAHSDSPFKRVFWPIWENHQDHPCQAHTFKWKCSCRWSLCHISPKGGCCAGHCSCRWTSFAWRWQRCHASELWDYKILYGFSSWYLVCGPWLYEPPWVGRWEGLLHQRRSDDPVCVFSLCHNPC